MKSKKLLTIIIAAALLALCAIPAALAAEDRPIYVVVEEDIVTPTPTGNGGTGDGGGQSAIDPTANGKYWLTVALWHAGMTQESMGNVAFKGIKALLTTADGKYTLHVGAQPVEVTGYTTAITEVERSDKTEGITGDIEIVTAGNFTTNTKFDGVAHELSTVRVFGLELENTTREYIFIRFKVPYTPMDAVGASTDGWLDARLRIYWSSIENAPANAVVDPPTSIAKGASSLDSGSGGTSADGAPSYDKSDNTTGIRITAGEGVIPEGAELAVSEITETATDAKSQTAYASAVTALEETAAKFVLYDISITAENAEVQPNGSITLRIPIPAEFDKSKTALYRINDDKTATLIRGNVSGDTYIVTLSHLSLYALAEGLTAVASPADAFTDISGHWAYDYIRYMIERGLIVGVTSTTFEPNTVMTRAMFVTLLGRIAGVDTAANAGTAFDDVGADEYYAPYTVWASKNGIVSGVGDNKFAPDMQITREQMAAMLNNYVEFAKITLASGSGPAFADAGEISSWASAAVRKMADAGIIAGVGDNKFAPKLTASRAEVATLLARFLQGLVV